eukprot:g6256.t1
MAASVSSLGPPTVGPGNSAPTVYRRQPVNKEPLSGNTLCHKNNVERKHAIHEHRLASVKASLSLNTPRRMDFMDKRLSKNFHMRRHHEQVVHENLKLLRALEEIHSRSSNTGPDNLAGGRGGAASGGGDGGLGGASTGPVSLKRRKGVQSSSAGRSCSRKKLSSLLARKRNVKAALVARENQKMMERMTRSKSLYSRDKMRQHRVRHQRVLRLRKTDYTAGHLLVAATARRHWGGGDSRDDGFSYSFEEGRHNHSHSHSHSHRNRKAKTHPSSSTGTSRSPRHSSTAARGTSYSPARSINRRSINTGAGRGGRGGGRGTRSAPRLPSLLDVDDIYGGGSILGSPNLEQCLQAAEMSARSGGGGGGGGGASGSRASSSRTSAAGSGNHEEDDSRPRPSTDGGGIGGRGGARQHRKSSPRHRGGRDAAGGGSSIGGVRGTDGSVDSISRRGLPGSDDDSPGSTRGGRYSRRRNRGRGGRDDKSSRSSGSDGNAGNEADLDEIFNPLAFLDDGQGVRVLIQATKPLEVCRRVLSLEEANAICAHAQNGSGGKAVHDRPLLLPSLPGVSLTPAPVRSRAASDTTAGDEATAAVDDTATITPLSESATRVAANPGAGGGGGATGEETVAEGGSSDPRAPLVATGLGQYSANGGNLNDLLSKLFKEADKEGKGFLTPEQLTSIMQNAELGLTGPELHLVIAEADDNADGTIDAIHALYDAEFDRLVRQLKALCKSQDPKGKGVLPRAEFKQCISADRCGGLTKIEAKLLLNLLPKDSHGNVIYRKLGAGLEQVRFTTLRNTVAEASATDTQKYLMTLCREEDAKSDTLGSKGHLKTNGDGMAIGGKHYSGMLRARQLTKLLLNAPLLSLSRLHVTALMSQAHIVDGMVNYVELVPMIAKTIEGMFHPRSLKMRHEIFKNRGSGGAGAGAGAAGGVGGSGGVGGGALGEGGAPGQPMGPATTVLEKSREDIQRIFVDVLREDKQGSGIERLKDPATFTRCMASLGLDLEPDTISALWVASDLDSRDGTTFVDVVDFCFNCVLFMEREKEARIVCLSVKSMQRTRNTATRASQAGRAAPGAAAVARAEAVAAAALAAGEVPPGKAEPLLSLARALVRHAKVTDMSEGKVGLEFPLDRHTGSSAGGSTVPGDATSSSAGEQIVDDRGRTVLPDAAITAPTLPGADDEDEDNLCGSGGAAEGAEKSAGRRGGEAAGLQLRSEAPGSTILLRARRKMPIVGPSGQKIMAVSTKLPSPRGGGGGGGTPPAAAGTTTTASSGEALAAPHVGDDNPLRMPPGPSRIMMMDGQRESGGGLEVAEAAARGETRDAVVHVYWDGPSRDRAHVEVFPAEGDRGWGGGPGDEGDKTLPLLRLGVRVPTLAIVDAQAAVKFAERVVQQIAIQIDDENGRARGRKRGGTVQQQHWGQRQQQRWGQRLRLAGVDAKSVVAGN